MKWLFLLLILVPFAAAATLQDAKDAYLNASVEVKHLKLLGFSTEALDDSLTQMRDAMVGANVSELVMRANLLNESNETEKVELAQQLYLLIGASLKTGISPGVNYTFVVEKAAWIQSRKEKAFVAADLIAGMKETLSKVNETLNLTSVSATMVEAESAFKAERYDEIPHLIQQAQVQLEEARVSAARERAFLRLAQRNIVAYVRVHWLGLLITLAILLAFGAWAYLEARLYYGLSLIRKTKTKLAVNGKLQEQTQEGYYADGMGSQTYRSRMDMLKQKQRQLKTKLQVWEKLVIEYGKYSVINRFRQS